MIQPMPHRSITLLIPIYNERGNLAELVREIDAVVAGLPEYAFRLLFVDDGSSDGAAAPALSSSSLFFARSAAKTLTSACRVADASA